MGGSILKNLKNNLQEHDLLRHQKQRKGNAQQVKQRRDRDQESLTAIRNAFNPKLATAAKTQAEKQRKQTWEAEKRLHNKVGGMVDRRFGEKDNTMSEQDKMVERFAREKLNNLRRQNKKSFNIEGGDDDEFGDDEALLTHGGKALDFEDDFQEGDLGLEEEQERRNYDEAHQNDSLGADKGTDTPEQQERPKTKAEVMQEVIAKSKMHKFERQQQQQQDNAAIDSLNAGFDDLMAELAPLESQRAKDKREVDNYDANVQEFSWDRRAEPGDRTKTAEELKAEAEEKRIAAERAQVARMEGDDLDIDLDYEDAKDDANLFGLDDQDNDTDISDSQDNSQGTENHSSITVNIPQTYEDLKKLDPSVEQLRYFVKTATPGRGSGNRQQLHIFAAALVDFAIKTPSRFGDAALVLHDVASTHETGIYLANHTRDLVHSAKRRPVWKESQLLLFSLVGSLFSTSDQWHVVATSASLAITQRISASIDTKSITQNLFLCELLLVYQRISKRYIPEIPGYLLRVLAMMNKGNVKIAERYVRLSPHGWPLSTTVEDGSKPFKIGQTLTPSQAVNIIAKIVARSASLWRSLDAFVEIFTPLKDSLINISRVQKGNDTVSGAISQLERLLHFSFSERKYLELQNFRPSGIKTQAPLFDENYNPDIKGQGMDPEKRELQKLKALHKKERKSTLREIRRDAEFESRQRLQDKRTEMDAYHNKLKRLEGQINGEEGAERNAYERERKRRRK